jgi:hypothetical protein
MSQENLGLKARLSDSGTLEVPASPVQHFTDGPFVRQVLFPPCRVPTRRSGPTR